MNAGRLSQSLGIPLLENPGNSNKKPRNSNKNHGNPKIISIFFVWISDFFVVLENYVFSGELSSRFWEPIIQYYEVILIFDSQFCKVTYPEFNSQCK
jgi:hypothetical protein